MREGYPYMEAMVCRLKDSPEEYGCRFMVDVPTSRWPVLFLYRPFVNGKLGEEDRTVAFRGYPVSQQGLESMSGRGLLSTKDIASIPCMDRWMSTGVVLMYDRNRDILSVCPDGLYRLLNKGNMMAEVEGGVSRVLNPEPRMRNMVTDLDDRRFRMHGSSSGGELIANNVPVITVARRCILKANDGEVLMKSSPGFDVSAWGKWYGRWTEGTREDGTPPAAE